MKNKRMLHILNEIDDALIAEAAPKEEAAPKAKTPKHRDWIKWSAAAACFCLLLIGTIFAVQGGLFTKTPGKSVEDHGWMIKEMPRDDKGEVGFPVPRWEEMAICQQFFEAEYRHERYSSRVTEISADMIGAALGTATLKGVDVYTEKEYTAAASLYAINGISDACAVALQFEGENDYYVYVNSYYQPKTLGEFLEALNLRETISFGSAWYRHSWNGERFSTVEFTDLADAAVWEMLLSDPSLVNTAHNPQTYIPAKLMDIGVDIPLLGYKNIAFWITEDGYLETNILDTKKAFYIGEEKSQAFVNYVIETCTGYEIVYTDSDQASATAE